MLREGDNCWRIAHTDRMAVIVDSDDYFRLARDAFLKAERRIMLVGWDFDARIRLTNGDRLPGEPEALGDFLYWLVEQRPDLELYLLRWDVGALKTLGRGSTVFTVLKWMRHPRIHTKLDGAHPTGGSHHQKIVSIDDRFAVCGGIDMTSERWDTRAHRDDDPGRRRPGGQPYGPWHDATSALSGDAAATLAEGCRDRWYRATGDELGAVVGGVDAWPEALEPQFRDIDVGIARTLPVLDDTTVTHEIEALFVAQIAAARDSIYMESQYFASRKVAEAIAHRLDEANGPEIVIVNPVTAQGWLEPVAMDSARGRLMEALRRRDRHGRLRMYHPVTQAGEPIYVHAKITFIDDRQLRIGSANLNNRSMRLDSECDVIVDAGPDGDSRLTTAISTLRDDLLAEHLGVPLSKVTATLAETGSLIATVERLRGSGRTLVPFCEPNLSAVEAWLADHEVLDPEGPEEMFEALSARGLFRRLRKPKT
ncbi:phospholipase D-like domain-containing protein [Sphingomonas sp. SUN039]|uniref:phospholipase D-like domain-containing protein n=1 Tax=Sphingomonas sp. SUN039 TaxID=2937787 RepID=UPI0038D393B1